MTTTLAFHPLTRWTLWIELRLDQGPVHAEPVTEADLVDLRAECWWEAVARRGALAQPRGEFEPRMSAVALDDARGPEDGCAGLLLEATDPSGERVRCVATSRAFDPVAQRALAVWLERGGDASTALKEACFHLCALPGQPSEENLSAAPNRDALNLDAPNLDDGVWIGDDQVRELEVLHRPLQPLLAGAESIGDDIGLFPVLYTRAARAAAEAASRRGARREPPVESGALLLGYLGSCPESGEAFAVVTEALPAAEDGTTFSLSIPARTWHDARARCARRPGLRVLGQAHGHNFTPQLVEGSPCASCPRPAGCECDSAFLSTDDRTWSRAVFHGQPWQVGQVFGLDAAGKPVEAFFGQRGARLVPRGFHLIDDFDGNLTP